MAAFEQFFVKPTGKEPYLLHKHDPYHPVRTSEVAESRYGVVVSVKSRLKIRNQKARSFESCGWILLTAPVCSVKFFVRSMTSQQIYTVPRGCALNIETNPGILVVSVVAEDSRPSTIQVFANDVVQLIKDENFNPRKGAVASESLKAVSKRLSPEVFQEAVSSSGSWEQALSASGSVALFAYSHNELSSRSLQNHIAATETRVAVNSSIGEGNVSLRPKFQQYLRTLLSEQLLKGRLPLVDMLNRCSAQTNLHCSSPCFSSAMRLLQQHDHSFSWTTDPSRKTIVDKRKLSKRQVFGRGA